VRFFRNAKETPVSNGERELLELRAEVCQESARRGREGRGVF